MKKLQVFSLLVMIGMCFGACQLKQQEGEAHLLSFDPQDSVLVDELMRFYIDSNIIPQEALLAHQEGELYTFDCVSDNCEIVNDFMQDSLSDTFFVEVTYDVGSAGNNNIYICHRSPEGFSILFSTIGQINCYLGPDTIINNYKVLYVQTENQQYKLFFDGTHFVMEDYVSNTTMDVGNLTEI